MGSIEGVLAKPEFVTINTERLAEMAAEMKDAAVPPWDNDLQLLGTPEETAQYYFFLDSTNFCFWTTKSRARWEYQVNGEWQKGYYAYSRALKDAYERDPRMFDANYLRAIPEEDFRAIFAQGRNELLLMDERLAIIRENYGILADKYEGSVLKLIEAADTDADKLVELLLDEFTTFRDTAEFEGETVYLLKRPQIFCSDLYFTGLPELKLKNLEHLTIFADYKLPQLLEQFGALHYASELTKDIETETLIPPGSQKELELRASSIAAVEILREEMEKLGRSITSNELDWILWVKAKQMAFAKPHHRTLTTFY